MHEKHPDPDTAEAAKVARRDRLERLKSVHEL
jgi:hypothetical protein